MRVLGGQAGIPSRARQEPLYPSDVVGQMAIIHQYPAFQIGLNIMEINKLRVVHN
jgi:hypothetical protein